MAAGGQGFPRGVFATIIANQANIRPPETASRSKELIVVNQRDIGLWCASFGVSLASQTLSPCVRVRLARLFGVGFVRDRYRPLILSPQQSKRFNYKVTILNSTKRGKKPITRQLHHFDGKFRSVTDVKVHLMEELGDEVPSTIHFDVGYYEKRSNKCWLVTSEDLDGMYSSMIYHCGVMLRLKGQVTRSLKGKEEERLVPHHQSWRKTMSTNTSEFLPRNMEIHTVYLSEGCGPELFIVAHMTVMTLHLLFLCSDLLLSVKRKKDSLMQ